MNLDNLRLAAGWASLASHDSRTQNAAVIDCVNGRLPLAANSFPVKAWIRHDNTPQKLTYIEHAERAAIYYAARHGLSCDGATMYCPWFACPECARAIISAGITTVVGCSKLRALTPERWREPIAVADRMLEDAGIDVVLTAELLGVTIRFDGQEVEL